ncbi:ArnT family glycosyltransferase [Gemmatimonas sp.]|jgi:hypothetical protein|uniref:ArnT family glycosyltransferase n=1 Tax=Gemmatimonas sp. TaxID=1962908 RepID=UPI0037C0C158
MSARLPSRTLIIAASLLVRATVAVVLGLGVDEAYAVSVARPWSVSYFDHPPLHFWLAGAMTWLTGSTEAIAVRLPFLVLFTGTLWLVGQLTARAFGDVAARYAVLALAASGVLGITSGSWVLPDGPLLFLSMLGVYLLYPLVVDETTGQEPAEHGKWRWFAAGLAFGAAALAKYHALLLVSGLGMYLLLDAHARRHLRTPWPWMALLIVMVACTPVVWWNAQHEWVSFRFQGGRAHAEQWSPAPFVEMLGGQIAWLLPWVSVPLGIALVRAPANGQRAQRARRLFRCIAALPILAFSLIPLGGARGLPHWTAPGWLYVFPLLGAWAAATPTAGRWLRGGALATASLVAALVLHVSTPVVDRFLSASVRDKDPTRDGVRWDAAIVPADLYVVRSWIQGGQVGVAAGPNARIVCLCADPHHFPFRHPGDALGPGERGVLLERRRGAGGTSPVSATQLGGDSLSITVRDTVSVGRGVEVIRYDVVRAPQKQL